MRLYSGGLPRLGGVALAALLCLHGFVADAGADLPPVDRAPTAVAVPVRHNGLRCAAMAINNKSEVLLSCAPDGSIDYSLVRWSAEEGFADVTIAPKFGRFHLQGIVGFGDDGTVVGTLSKPTGDPSSFHTVGFVSGDRYMPSGFVPQAISSDGKVIVGYTIDGRMHLVGHQLTQLLRGSMVEDAVELGGSALPTPSRVNNEGMILGQATVPIDRARATGVAFKSVSGGHVLLADDDREHVSVRAPVLFPGLTADGLQLNNAGDIALPLQHGHYTGTDDYHLDYVTSRFYFHDGGTADIGSNDQATQVTGLNDNGVAVGIVVNRDGLYSFVYTRKSGLVPFSAVFRGDADTASRSVLCINNKNEVLLGRFREWKSETIILRLPDIDVSSTPRPSPGEPAAIRREAE